MTKIYWLMLLPLTGQAVTLTQSLAVNLAIPDNNLVGISSTMTLVTSTPITTGVEVSLDMSSGVPGGGWFGDVYAYLIHSTGFSVLLNRTGRTAANLAGSGNHSVLLTLSDGATTNVHMALPNTGALSGIFQPDGRNISPANSLDTTVPTTHLGVFNTLDSSGEWTLFVADVAAGETMTLNSWQLTVNPVPEPSAAVLGVLGLSLVWRRRR